MDFDPLELFTPEPSSFVNTGTVTERPDGKHTDVEKTHSTAVLASAPINHQDNTDLDEDAFLPIHIHDLPLLRCSPPAPVLIAFLRLLSPETSLNFAPPESTAKDATTVDIKRVFREKNVAVDPDSWLWLSRYCPRFGTPLQLAAIPELAATFKNAFTSQYNGWLTQLISCEFSWICDEKKEQIQALAALRLAENCGRTAQPEMLRSIEIPMLPHKLYLKEPSLTADNLGLKTWGSSFVLGSRLASQPEKKYLVDPVLELGAGTGLVGMVSCCLGHATMLTDLAEIVPNLQANVGQNGVENARVAELDWSKPSSFLGTFGHVKFATIILSDPLYSSQHPQWIVNMINLFLSPEKHSRVLLQIPVRRTFENERASLWHLMEENGYSVEEECEELGYDDFGESSFIFKKYVRVQSDASIHK